MAPKRLESAITIEPSLWTLRKSGHEAIARVRPIDCVGLELWCEWDGELRASQVFKTWDELEAAAAEKRRQLQARGWLVATRRYK